MNEIKLKAYAKINLSIDIISKRSDNYHNVEMIMQQIDLHDVITIKKNSLNKINIISENKDIPFDNNNIAYKVARYILDNYNISTGIDIYIEKNIPIAAGLAGGSSDAAAVIKGMNKLFSLNLSIDTMKEIGVKFGADIPFCIEGGACIATGIGEKLKKIEPLNAYILLIKPDINVSTKEVYENLDLSSIKNHPNTNRIVDLIKKDKKYLLKNEMYNVLEEVTIKMHPEIKSIKEKMYNEKAIVSMMSGSGPTVFGIYDDYNEINLAYNNLMKEYKNVYIARQVNGSF